MPRTSARLDLEEIDPPDFVTAIREAINNHADTLDAAVTYDEGPLGGRPVSTSGTPGIAGRTYRATDQPGAPLYRDTGTGWALQTESGATINDAVAYALALGG